MKLQYIIFQIVKSLSLISWYFDSPQTANFGKKLANCNEYSLACLEAGQNALRVYHQEKADLEKCQRLERLAEIDANRAQEQLDQEQARKMEHVMSVWNQLGGTFHVTYIDNSQHLYIYGGDWLTELPPNMSFEELLRALKAQCGKLSDSMRIEPPKTMSQKNPPRSIDPPGTYPLSDSRWKAFIEEHAGISPDVVWDNILSNLWFWVPTVIVFFLGFLVAAGVVLRLVFRTYWGLGKLYRHCFGPLQNNELSQTGRPTQVNQAAQPHQQTEPASPAPGRESAKAHHAQQPDNFSPRDQLHQPTSTPSSVSPEQALRSRQPTQPEVPDTVTVSTTLVETSELELLRKQANDMRGYTNANKIVTNAIEKVC